MVKVRRVLEKVRFDANGLVPAIAQNEAGDVLMLAYMDKKALKRTLATGSVWYYSRKRKKLWRKGEESGNTQRLLGISLDCDCDTLLLTVRQKENACHKGSETCFGERKFGIARLLEIIESRGKSREFRSYTKRLLGDRKLLLEKIAEESEEVLDAARKKEGKSRLVWESCDLLYHLLVLFSSEKISLADLEKELERRHMQKAKPI